MFVSVAMFACKSNSDSTATTEDPNLALFKENSKVIQKSFDSFVKRDLIAWAENFSDSMKHNSALIGDTAVTKASWLKSMQGFNALTKEFKISKVFYYPTIDSLNKPDGGVVTFTEITSVLLNGDEVKAKYFNVSKFNSDHKIISANEFFDAGSFLKLATAAAKVK